MTLTKTRHIRNIGRKLAKFTNISHHIHQQLNPCNENASRFNPCYNAVLVDSDTASGLSVSPTGGVNVSFRAKDTHSLLEWHFFRMLFGLSCSPRDGEQGSQVWERGGCDEVRVRRGERAIRGRSRTVDVRFRLN